MVEVMSTHKAEAFVREYDSTNYGDPADATRVMSTTVRLRIDVTIPNLTPADAEAIRQRSRNREPFKLTLSPDVDVHALAVEMARMAYNFADDRCADESAARAAEVRALLGDVPF